MAAVTDVGSRDAGSALTRRPQTAADEAFCFQLFSNSRPPGQDLSAIEPALREILLRQLFAGQSLSYRSQFPAARYEIVACAGEPIGRLVFDLSPVELHVIDVALMPAWRGRGIGTRLLQDLLARARAEAVPVELSVAVANDRARALYERLGFHVVAQGSVDLAMRWHSPS